MSPDVTAILTARAAADGPRIERVEVSGRGFWIKRREHLSLRMRLQKGSAKAAFAAEVAAHRDYARRGLPVAPVVAASDTYLITEDCGTSLKSMARAGASGFEAALQDAARALASLHQAGVSHGRPSLKDICWRDGKIAFIDLERAGRDPDQNSARAMDVIVLIFSTAVETRCDHAAMTAARDAYLAAGQEALWQAARTCSSRYRWIGRLLSPVALALRGNREFDAIGPFFRFMAKG